MQFKTLVRQEHLNQYGNLFGGYMLLWVDEFAYLAAIEDYPCVSFVTRAMEAASFTQSVKLGSVLTFTVTRQKIGHTSVTYDVNVTARDVSSCEPYPAFRTSVTLCAVTKDGRKMPLPSSN